MEQATMPNVAPPTWITLRQASRNHHVSADTVRAWIGSERVRGVRVPYSGPGAQMHWYVCPEDLRAALGGRPRAKNAPVRLGTLLDPEQITVHANRAVLMARIVADAYEIAPEVLLSSDRLPVSVEGRRVLLVLLSEMPALYKDHGFTTDRGWGLTEISRMIGRDHATAHHHLKRITTCPTPEETAMLTECRAMVRRALIAQVQRRKERKATPVPA